MADSKKDKNNPRTMRGKVKAELVNPVGRPRKTTADLPVGWQEMMLEESRQGGGPTAIRRALKLGGHGLDTLLADDEEFRAIYEECLLECASWWEKTGRDLACGVIEKGNGSVWSLNMTNRFNWRTGRNEVVGDKNNPLQHEHRSAPATKEQLIEELERRGLPTSIFDSAESVDD